MVAIKLVSIIKPFGMFKSMLKVDDLTESMQQEYHLHL